MMRRYPPREVRVTLPCGHWRTVDGSVPIRDWRKLECWGCLLGVPA